MVGLPVCFVLMFLLCQLTGSAASDSQKELVGAIGGSVTFPLNLSIVNIGSIVWIFNSTLVTFQPPKGEKPPMIIVTQSHKEKRVSFRNGECSLTLSKLQKNDSGTYRVEVHSTRNKLFTQEYVLHVYEPLSKPKVTMSLENTENGTCMVNLTCSLEQQGEDVAYSWKSLGKAANESHVGAIFPFSWRQGERNMTFICEATNPVSSNISLPVSSWKLCEESHPRGRSNTYTLFHCAHSKKGGQTLLPIHDCRHTRAICL
ncbi:SLAM family member 7 [Tenrec ecaudatus]|uniref:SLAM family member 7 n=1 Tax=Tenrec ecaudatus TaxID=94439 RepID=UPI003F5A4491